jgi:hypothetical protein
MFKVWLAGPDGMIIEQQRFHDPRRAMQAFRDMMARRPADGNVHFHGPSGGGLILGMGWVIALHAGALRAWIRDQPV